MTPPTWPVAPTMPMFMPGRVPAASRPDPPRKSSAAKRSGAAKCGLAAPCTGRRRNEVEPPPKLYRQFAEAEGVVEQHHGPLGVALEDDAADPDGRGRDHLDVDARLGEGLEHGRGHAGVRLHPGPDEADPGDGVVADHGGRADLG